MTVLDVLAIALSAASLLMLVVLVGRRGYLGVHERRRTTIEAGLKTVALELLHSGAEPPAALGGDEKQALADVLGRYARAVRGPTRDRIVAYFTREGTVDVELASLAAAPRAWRRAQAAFRLGDIATVDAAPALIAALHDSDRDVRSAAARSLGRLRVPEAGPELLAAAAERVPAGLVRWSVLQIGEQALPQLRSLLDSPEPGERAGAVTLIGLLGGPRDAAAVQERLGDDSSRVRAQAARALGRLGSERNLPALLAALEDQAPDARGAAAGALGQLRDRRSLEPLCTHSVSDLFDVARAAARAVAAIDPAFAAERARSTGSVHLWEAADLAALR